LKKKLWIFLGFIAVIISLYLYLFVDSPARREASIDLARDAAMKFLLTPNENSINVGGEKSLLLGCANPILEKTFALSEKGRFEFRVICRNKETAFIFVFMRHAPPDFMVISKTGLFGDGR
jgi:hypothetical protein